MDKTMKKGIINILAANILNLFLNLITSFILPKYLSIEAYSLVKTFQLYINYAGFLHFGYVDGMYLKYGGLEFKEINQEEFKKDLSTMRFFQIIILIIWLMYGIYLKDYIIIAFSFSILPQNMNSYFRYLFQSIGEFKKYSSILNITSIGVFITNIFLLLIINSNNGYIFCVGYVTVYIMTWLVLEYQLFKKIGKCNSVYSISLHHLKSNITLGFFLMLGTFSSIILTSIDRWFVKFLLDTKDFAEYSFAVNMENFINTLVTPITVTLYNYFCRTKDNCNFLKLRNQMMFFSVYVVSAAFAAKFILETYLTNYYSSTHVMFILFSSQIFFIIVKSIYVNLYKMKKQQTKYFSKLIIVIVFGIFANIICFFFIHEKEAFAIGTLVSSFFWYSISINDFDFLKINFKDFVFPIVETLIFLICGFMLNAISGFIVYIFVSSLLIYFFYTNEVKQIIKLF